MRILLFACLAGTLYGQKAGPVVTADEFLKAWQNSKKFTIEVAEAMPSEKYVFKATDAEMAFGGLMNHIGAAQAYRFSRSAAQIHRRASWLPVKPSRRSSPTSQPLSTSCSA